MVKLFKMGMLISFLTFSSPMLFANDMTPEQLEAWFNDDENTHPVPSQSNDGQLEFMPKPPTKPALHSQNRLTILPDSLTTGWVKIEQCYDGLDPIGAVEVVYRYKQMRNLKIKQHINIGKVRVDGQSIQLEDVEKGARICTEKEARILIQLPEGRYALFNGPFQRRFFDSYFPMRVSIVLSYPQQQLQLTAIDPARTPGYVVADKPGELSVDAWFKGKLLFRAEFEHKK